MPRTKAHRGTQKSKINAELENVMQLLKEKVEQESLSVVNQILKLEKDILRKLECLKCTIPESLAAKTIGEIEHLSKSGDIFQSLCETNSISTQIIELTDTIKKDRKLPTSKRSRSYAEDDGYLTAESMESQRTGSRVSRSRQKKPRTEVKRVSRSVSASKTQKTVSTYRTPLKKNNVPSSFGMVTPKMKPNTPQVVLRRPKEGEVAISLQGSPLMVNPLVSEKMASINIPFQDGKVLSIQPQRGLRISQIPEMDEDTMRQMQTLRDNLNKVCSMKFRK